MLVNCERCYEEVGVDTIDLGIIELTPSFLYRDDITLEEVKRGEDVIKLMPKLIRNDK